jgi:hydroxysqualene synthase
VPDFPASLAGAYAACEKLARSHYENFPVASRLLPAAMRPHVAALYAFARVADDIADEGSAAPEARRVELQAWQAGLHRAVSDHEWDADARPRAARPDRGLDGDSARILIAAAHSIRTLGLPLALFDDLVSAFGQDIMTTRYASWADLLDYCRRSANPVGRLVLRIAGYRDDRLDRASDALCTALQLTNFWQDLSTDWRAGRLYVPGEAARAAGASEDTLRGDRLTDAWADAVVACAAFTRERFSEGREVCDGVHGRLRAELRFTWLGGMRVLERVEQGRFELLQRRPRLSARDAPLLVWRALTWTRET